MRNAITAFILCLCASLLLNMNGIGMADAVAAAGPDEKNFIYYVNTSGSMSLNYHERGTSRIDVAVNLLHAINDEMPDIDANIGVYTFAPHKEFRRVSPFDRDALTEAFNQIPTDFQFAGRVTPMSHGILNLDPMIAALPGTVDFIVATDGGGNVGPSVDEVIENVYLRFGDRVCFHFISFAKDSSEKAFIKTLSDLNDCSVSVEAVDLLDESARADFIENLF